MAAENKQTLLLFLGIHAVALTISEAFYGKRGEDGYTVFLKEFVDKEVKDKRFSEISDTIHDWRNIIAHQWLSKKGHMIGYDYTMDLGWEKRDEKVFINPEVYYGCYIDSFRNDGRLWRYSDIFNKKELLEIKERIINKYLNR